jgi:Xaa-Pro dipeptidase
VNERDVFINCPFTADYHEYFEAIYERNDVALEPGMTMFLHMVLMDSDSATALCLGRTSLILEGRSEPLNGRSLDLVVR